MKPTLDIIAERLRICEAAPEGPWKASPITLPQWRVSGPKGPFQIIALTSQCDDEAKAVFIADAGSHYGETLRALRLAVEALQYLTERVDQQDGSVVVAKSALAAIQSTLDGGDITAERGGE